MKNKLILPNQDLVTANGTVPISITKPKEIEKVFLGMPSRTGLVQYGSAQAAMMQSTKDRIDLFRVSAHTNLELNYNMLLCDALNLRDNDGITWFAMLHDDVQPEPYWVDTLINEAEKYHADFMSAHV